ncbi:hypothetical protein [Marichromatium sp. AB32]|uniref:hypothetical protein n=1 Tax=Marichromatium sp. AB32 TaxID=2483363 RepID=UPI000F401B6B|nr:hypothetical protein [Marichromatium sp. AB32]RNE88343.1 hypothetical protein EBL85_16555 [Marichromatium sp. AB32]
MQFKRQGKRIQVLAYRGYDREKRRSIVKMVGSFDRYSLSPSDELMEKLTAEEKEELEAFIEKERQAFDSLHRSLAARCIAETLQDAVAAIESEEFEATEAWAAEAWAAINTLSKTLRRAGYPRPKKTRPPKTPAAAVHGAAPPAAGVDGPPGQVDLDLVIRED